MSCRRVFSARIIRLKGPDACADLPLVPWLVSKKIYLIMLVSFLFSNSFFVRRSRLRSMRGICFTIATNCLLRLSIWAYSSHTRLRPPCFSAFRDERALPSFVLGPLDFSQGFQRLIASACLRLLSSVHPFAMRKASTAGPEKKGIFS